MPGVGERMSHDSALGSKRARIDASTDVLLPWLREEWTRLSAARRSGRLAHGLLISGPRGVGKRHLAERLAHSLLCGAPDRDGAACGQCADCRLLQAASHPDLLHVGPEPEAKSSEITIGAVRALVERGALTPSRGVYKVALIEPADQLNAAAANALLKTLEEPPGTALICLIAERVGRLPATVRSRCQQVRIGIPPLDQALVWLRERVPGADLELRLRIAHGAPLRLLQDLDEALLARRRERLDGLVAVARGARDPVVEAAAWSELDLDLALDWLTAWAVDLLRMSAHDAPSWLDNPDQRAGLAALAAGLDVAATHRWLQRLLRVRALGETRINPQLLFEACIIEWARIGAGRTPGRP